MSYFLLASILLKGMCSFWHLALIGSYVVQTGVSIDTLREHKHEGVTFKVFL